MAGGSSADRLAGIEIRAAEPSDRSAILQLMTRSLGWEDDPRFAELFEWKHEQNPFGPSPAWVAFHGDRLVGLRTFMRWEFVDGRAEDRVVRAVRAVDTATDPDYQGRGLFRTMTMRGVDELTAEGIDFVFNTPNDQSRPGYLKMGWEQVGDLPAAVRFRGPVGLVKAARSRVPSDFWSQPLDIGVPAGAWLDTADPFVAPPGPVLRTNRTIDFLRWRYGTYLLGYRALPVSGGALIVRARMRGRSRELVLADALGVTKDEADHRLGQALRDSNCDHAIRLGTPNIRALVPPLPGGGPLLTWRALASTSMPSLDKWSLRMGDVELF